MFMYVKILNVTRVEQTPQKRKKKTNFQLLNHNLKLSWMHFLSCVVVCWCYLSFFVHNCL